MSGSKGAISFPGKDSSTVLRGKSPWRYIQLAGKTISCRSLAEGTQGVETGGATGKLPARPWCWIANGVSAPGRRFLISSGSWMMAITFISEPHFRQTNGSTGRYAAATRSLRKSSPAALSMLVWIAAAQRPPAARCAPVERIRERSTLAPVRPKRFPHTPIPKLVNSLLSGVNKSSAFLCANVEKSN